MNKYPWGVEADLMLNLQPKALALASKGTCLGGPNRFQSRAGNRRQKVRLGKILLLIWLFALAQGAQGVAAPRENALRYDECVSAASFEYWDQDAQLLYLRARWYDPRIGQFVSADPFEGKQQNPRSLNRYAYAHNDSVHGTDPSGETNLNETGAVSSGVGVLGGLSLPAIGTYLATAKTTHLAIASVPFMAMHGPRINQFIQGSGRAGFDALQRSVLMVARGASATQQQIQSAWNVGSGYTNTLNQMMGTRASQYGYQIHRLLEGNGSRLSQSITQSLANMAPTPIAPHLAISKLHSTNMFVGQSMTVRQYLVSLNNTGRLTVEQWFKIEAEIWARAMQGQQLTPQVVRELLSTI